MRVRVGCTFDYDAPGPITAIWQVRPRPEDAHRLLMESWGATPPLPTRCYRDAYGNICDRMTLPPGQTVVRYDATVEAPGHPDDTHRDARQVPVDELPDETLVFLLPSRFCLSDVLHDLAWDLFGATKPGWARVQAVSDWVH